MSRFMLALCLFGVSGCGLILDFDPRPVSDMPDASLDGSSLDGSIGDGSLLVDGDILDGSLDGSHHDGSVDLDGSFNPDADVTLPPDPCSDEPGLCIRFHHADLMVTGIQSNMYWTEGGVTVESGWTTDSCVGGLRIIDDTTVDCLFHAIPLPGSRNIYFYPRSDTSALCDTASCPGFPDAWEYWVNGVSVSGTPGVGPVTVERRPTPDGMIMAIKFTS